MKYTATKEFWKDLQKIKDKKIKNKLINLLNLLEASENPFDVINLKPLVGYPNFYRIKLDYHYRIGCFYDGEVLELKRLLTREAIYKKFP
ncbi:MAG: hypothetical protein SFU25_01240 [Candidatus Caenarcaniphilales bacterium]|nr:hypothetical protein [Candidatus Caenarcaniphilales bacterium]